MKRLLVHALFWSWNLVFLAFAGFGIGPVALATAARALDNLDLPASFIAYIVVLLATPVVSVLLVGWRLRARAMDHEALLRFFFTWEAPIVVLCFVRIFLVHELNAGLAYVFALLLLSTAVSLYAVFVAVDSESDWRLTSRLVLESMGLSLTWYLALCLAFYAVPALVALVREFPFRLLLQNLGAATLGLLLFLWSSTLFVALPVAMTWLVTRGWSRTFRTLAARRGAALPVLLAAATVFLTAEGNQRACRQPQGAAFAQLAALPASAPARKELVAHSAALREGLVNAYLSSFRYAAVGAEDHHIASIYTSTLHLSEASAANVQRLFNTLTAPLHYDGASFASDQKHAEELYQQFFDVPIQKAERLAIRDAVSATFETPRIDAGLMDIGAERVRVVQQDIHVDAKDDLAEIELHEVYENKTHSQQEVFYFFSLPESAVITGLWLGQTADRAKADRFVVASRGAAQRVYREQVRERRDPALVEQVGPRQYRLRAFPIPPRPFDNAPVQERMHLWLRYRAFAQHERWPLPRLIERRNASWDSSRIVTVDGQTVTSRAAWMPDDPPATHAKPQTHLVALSTGDRLVMQPSVERVEAAHQRLAIVFDRSRRMERHEGDVTATLAAVDALRGAGNVVEVYLGSGRSRGEAPMRLEWTPGPQLLTPFGSETTAELLAQFLSLAGDRTYDGVFVITDNRGLELGADKSPDVAAPLWLVHLGKELPGGYDDSLLKLLERPSSGIAATLTEAVDRLRTHAVDGYAVTLDHSEAGVPASDFADPLAVRQLIRRGGVASMEQAHTLATEYGVVSPFSSMIVLVSDVQKQRLAELEKRDDRFEREGETGAKVLAPHSSAMSVTGTPEPSEWLLLALMSAMLLGARRWRSV